MLQSCRKPSGRTAPVPPTDTCLCRPWSPVCHPVPSTVLCRSLRPPPERLTRTVTAPRYPQGSGLRRLDYDGELR